jgi:predicted TIM-barrel fold metal-dependent hydrolase
MQVSELRGRINDADSHLVIPARQYPEVLGPAGEALAQQFGQRTAAGFFLFDSPREAELTAENVWRVKGTRAPGACTPAGRLTALDLMGIDRQLVFPDVPVCLAAWGAHEHANDALRAYNDLAAHWTRESNGRLRAVGVLDTRNLGNASAEAERALRAGVRAFHIPDGIPPGGCSPAAPELDRLWALLAEARAPVLLHIGGQIGFMQSSRWEATEALRTRASLIGSESVGPHLMATIHMSPENFLATLVLGGVFERHPQLRVGVIELGAGWVGPMVERLEWVAKGSLGRTLQGLAMRPAEYVRRNVRVTPYVFEDIGAMIDRYGLEEVYAFSTDFPHPEGGMDPIERMAGSVSRHGDATLYRFMVTNSQWLLPD